MTLVPPADAAIGADAPVLTPEPADQSAGNDVPLDPAPPAPPVPDTTDAAAVLAITAPWQTNEFLSGVDDWEPITQAGTAGPAATADQVIAAGATCGVTIESR